ncbi:MAG: TatD family hydrolase [candidate division WOR-3 bacterium]
MFDTHAHLSDPAFANDLASVVENAHSSGVDHIIAVGYDFLSSQQSIKFAREKTWIYAAVGIHPHEAGRYQGDLSEIEMLTKEAKVIAIGETGLDFYRSYSPPDRQKDLFRRHIDLAKKTRKPLIIHVRQAFDEVLKILGEEDYHSGVFHCYSGDLNFARRIVEMGFYISFSGSITFAGSRLPLIINDLPRERILVETDAPFLTPVPLRGKRNEPANLKYVVRKISDVLNLPFDEIDRLTTENGLTAFTCR